MTTQTTTETDGLEESYAESRARRNLTDDDLERIARTACATLGYDADTECNLDTVHAQAVEIATAMRAEGANVDDFKVALINFITAQYERMTDGEITDFEWRGLCCVAAVGLGAAPSIEEVNEFLGLSDLLRLAEVPRSLM